MSHIQEVLSLLPVQPFSVLQKELEGMVGRSDGDENMAAELRPVLEPVLARKPFDEKWYLAAYPDVAKAALADGKVSSHEHFIRHGYFEGRRPTASDRIFS